MSEMLPQALTPFLQFAQLLRAHRFPVAPEQTQAFIQSVGILGPRSMRDIHRAARATLAPSADRFIEFDALFRLVFLGQTVAPETAQMDDDDELQAFDERDGQMEPPDLDELNEVGEQSTRSEALGHRSFDVAGDTEVFQAFRRSGAALLPKRKTRRFQASPHGRQWDLKRSLRDALRRDGEVLEIARRRPASRQRRVLLLIDISGSMKAQTELYFSFAHTLATVTDRLEVFTLGTRLTRVSKAVSLKRKDQAMQAAAALVSDWDGGTRLGDALEAFLAIPRFAGFARGSAVIVLSDGLERGDPDVMKAAVMRLSRLAWHLGWLTPLASDAGFEPRTQALQAVLPYLDGLGSGATATQLCQYLISIEAGSQDQRRSAA